MTPDLTLRRQSIVTDEPSGGSRAFADPRYVRQVLVNLLSSASKYGRDRDEIRLRLTEQGEWVRCAIEDHGKVGPFELDEREHVTRKNGGPLPVSVTEFRLVHRLMVDAGAVVPTEILLRHVWGADAAASTDVLRVTLHRLRQKMEDDPRRPRYLRTLPRFGVMFAV